ncbi:MAG: hypothetical protein KUA37_09575 [Desulfomicrobium sp.]|nr:hypothetical protein [Pseudomonadota bacterium]MBV1712239.1 hypothetical protein [Desulfomicrobium sp.]MBU4572876.1 hypothetical protein [Pseudomonadota bacterium]MBU4594871.1 hypothetical protein [Pseudomonadota bacterium]MBV1718489.1 hypothetical protein [Desulfomicrobium sp.]
MRQAENLLRQVQNAVRRLGIHPLILALGILFCLFFPRFFLLAAFAYAVFWVIKNIGFPPRGRNGRKDKERK